MRWIPCLLQVCRGKWYSSSVWEYNLSALFSLSPGCPHLFVIICLIFKWKPLVLFEFKVKNHFTYCSKLQYVLIVSITKCGFLLIASHFWSSWGFVPFSSFDIWARSSQYVEFCITLNVVGLVFFSELILSLTQLSALSLGYKRSQPCSGKENIGRTMWDPTATSQWPGSPSKWGCESRSAFTWAHLITNTTLCSEPLVTKDPSLARGRKT